MLLACDHHWWDFHRGVPGFSGLKIAQDKQTLRRWPSFLKYTVYPKIDDMQFDDIGIVGWGGNSGYQAVNLAAQLGAAKIIMVGFDMSIANGRHWFGEHPYRRNRPRESNVVRWRDVFDRQAPVLAGRGIKVINCSPVSALRNYPKMSLAEALEA